MEILCDNIKCKNNKDGLCQKSDGIHVDEVGFCRDCEEET